MRSRDRDVDIGNQKLNQQAFDRLREGYVYAYVRERERERERERDI